MPDFSLQMHKIQFWMGFRPPLGELTALPITLAELGGKGKGKKKDRERGKMQRAEGRPTGEKEEGEEEGKGGEVTEKGRISSTKVRGRP